MINSGMYSSATDEWATPQALFDSLDRAFHFTLDPCANEQNHKCERYYSRADDGLSQNWGGDRACSVILRMGGRSESGFKRHRKNQRNRKQSWLC